MIRRVKTNVAVLFFICIICLVPFQTDAAWNADNLARIAALGDHETFSFVVIGDTQGPGSRFPRVLPHILEEEGLLFVFNLGDLVNYATDEEYESTFFRHVRGPSQKLPFLTAASNHDHFRSRGAANYSRLFGSPHYYSFRVGRAAFIVLDNGQDWSLTEAQFEWLKDELEKARGYALRFVMMHRPLRDPRPNRAHDMNGRPENVERLSTLFDAYSVTMIFTGHIHSFYTGKWGNTPYIITGGGGGALYDRGTPASFHHYVRVDVTRDKAVYKVMKVNI